MDKTQQYKRRTSLCMPYKALLVLCGPAGAGKSTFAHHVIHDKGLHTTTIVSSDYCRALVCDDESNQRVNRDSFDLFYSIIHKRMFQGRFTIADSTALQADARRKLIMLAQQHAYYTCLLVFNTPSTLCIQRDSSRRRLVGEQVISHQGRLLQQALLDIPHEGWHQIHVLDEQHPTVDIAFATT